MARKYHTTPFLKLTAIACGTAALITGVWINVMHVQGAGADMIAAAIVVTLLGAAAPVMAERMIKTGQWLKFFGLALCFCLSVAFSFTATVSRTGGEKDASISANRTNARNAELAKDVYDQAKAAAAAECVKRGPKCRAAEQAVRDAAKDLAAAPAPKPDDSTADRLTAALPVTAEQVRIYQPLLLPLALELAGFVFLAIGFAPRREEKTAPVAKKKPKAKARQKPKAKPQVAKVENVIPFRIPPGRQ